MHERDNAIAQLLTLIEKRHEISNIVQSANKRGNILEKITK